MQSAHFTKLGEVPTVEMGNTEMSGAVMTGKCTAALGVEAVGGLVVHLTFGEGYLQPGHSHAEHESVGYVTKGRIRMVVDGDEQILTPGGMWWHPVGSHHITEALEPSEAVEIHIPPRPDVLKRFEGLRSSD